MHPFQVHACPFPQRRTTTPLLCNAALKTLRTLTVIQELMEVFSGSATICCNSTYFAGLLATNRLKVTLSELPSQSRGELLG